VNRRALNILLLYTDPYYLVKSIYPYGLDVIAHHLRCLGYRVDIDYPFLPEADPAANLKAIIGNTQPDVIGFGIRNIDTAMSCEDYGNMAGVGYRAMYFLPEVKRVVDAAREMSPKAVLIAGGTAFSISPKEILLELNLDYGISGPGEDSFLQFLQALPDEARLTRVPGLVFKTGNAVQVNAPRSFAFTEKGGIVHRSERFAYAYEASGLPVQTKRGCNQCCSYCVEPQIEGRDFVYRDIEGIASELELLSRQCEQVRSIFFTDAEFNIPDIEFSSRILSRIIDSGLNDRFRFTSQFLPKGFNETYAALLSKSGFSIVLTCDSFADEVLRANGQSYRMKNIEETLRLCEAFGLTCTVNLIFGLPGETEKTINQTLDTIHRFPPSPLREYEYTFGGRVYQDTRLYRSMENGKFEGNLYGKFSQGCLEPLYVCFPCDPMTLKAEVESNVPVLMESENLLDPSKRDKMSVAYLLDTNRQGEAVDTFLGCAPATQADIFEYLLRKLTDSGENVLARTAARKCVDSLSRHDPDGVYRDRIPVIRFYLSLLGEDS